MSSIQEKRRSSRYDFSLRILFRKDDEAHFYETRTENISAHGVFVQTVHQQLEVGTRVLLMLTGEEFAGSIPIKGRVSRIRDEGSDMEGPAGMAIDFEGVPEDKRQILGETFKRMESETGDGAN